MLYPKKTKNPNPSPIGNRFGFFLFGGRGWIRTTEAEKQQIYSLSPLATREHAHIQFAVSQTACIYYHWGKGLSMFFEEIFLQRTEVSEKPRDQGVPELVGAGDRN